MAQSKWTNHNPYLPGYKKSAQIPSTHNTELHAIKEPVDLSALHESPFTDIHAGGPEAVFWTRGRWLTGYWGPEWGFWEIETGGVTQSCEHK